METGNNIQLYCVRNYFFSLIEFFDNATTNDYRTYP